MARQPRPHWTKAVMDENTRLKQEIDELRMEKHFRAFAKRLGEDILLMLANKPYKDWPELAKLAFEHEYNKAPVIAGLYRRRLPTS